MDNKYNSSYVIELTTRDFYGTKLAHPQFKNHFGLLKVYAPWCPHCTSMVEEMKFLASELSQYEFQVGALNADNPVNRDLARELGVQFFPSFYMIKDDGSVESVNMGNHTLEAMLEVICAKTNEYSNGQKRRCCRKEGDKIRC